MEINKRDFFAAHALAGLAGRGTDEREPAEVAREAFTLADAMMRLSKTLQDPVEIDPEKLARR